MEDIQIFPACRHPGEAGQERIHTYYNGLLLLSEPMGRRFVDDMTAPSDPAQISNLHYINRNSGVFSWESLSGTTAWVRAAYRFPQLYSLIFQLDHLDKSETAWPLPENLKLIPILPAIEAPGEHAWRSFIIMVAFTEPPQEIFNR